MNIATTTYSTYPTGLNTNQPQIVPAEQKTPETKTNPASYGKDSPINPDSEPAGPDSKSSTSEQIDQSNTKTVNGHELTMEEIRLLDQLQKRDTEVRRHEMAHVTAGGRYITSGANFSYERGPDGKNYAVGGEVSIDTSPVPGDPQATIQKMKQIKNAALAPANPSAQDVKVASSATSAAAKALSELMITQAEEMAKKNEAQAFGDIKTAASTYEQVSTLPEAESSSFQIAV